MITPFCYHNEKANLWPHLDKFGKGLVDKDEGDEKGEDFLCETGDKANKDAPL